MGTLFRVYFCIYQNMYLSKLRDILWLSEANHIYKEVWEPIHGQILQRERENSNMFDHFAVSIMNDCEIVGHVL